MGNVRGVSRGGDARGLYKVVSRDQAAKPAAPMFTQAVVTLQTPALYCAVEDKQFPGTWRAQPMNYQGSGVVYLFRGDMAKYEALAWAKKKNKQWGLTAPAPD
jgi:hypothetical protein